MTGILRLEDWTDRVSEDFVESKENPDEWYVLEGKMVGDFDVNDADVPDELPEGNGNHEGWYQIGSQGWSEEAFADGVKFVDEYAGYGDDKIDTQLLQVLVVHEDVLSDQAMRVADGKEVAA